MSSDDDRTETDKLLNVLHTQGDNIEETGETVEGEEGYVDNLPEHLQDTGQTIKSLVSRLERELDDNGDRGDTEEQSFLVYVTAEHDTRAVFHDTVHARSKRDAERQLHDEALYDTVEDNAETLGVDGVQGIQYEEVKVMVVPNEETRSTPIREVVDR